MHLLVIRFSALGDVAMTVPVIYTIARKRPDLHITVLSRPFASPLFASMPPNVSFVGADLKKEYKGLKGLCQLFVRLRKKRIDRVIDLHDVLRTKLLRCLFTLSGTPSTHIRKGRKEKKRLVKGGGNKGLESLPSSFERYATAFYQAGITEAMLPEVFHSSTSSSFHSVYGNGKGDVKSFCHIVGVPNNQHWIGIAPFAAHVGKIIPAETISQVISHLAARTDYRIFLFGGGDREEA